MHTSRHFAPRLLTLARQLLTLTLFPLAQYRCVMLRSLHTHRPFLFAVARHCTVYLENGNNGADEFDHDAHVVGSSGSSVYLSRLKLSDMGGEQDGKGTSDAKYARAPELGTLDATLRHRVFCSQRRDVLQGEAGRNVAPSSVLSSMTRWESKRCWVGYPNMDSGGANRPFVLEWSHCSFDPARYHLREIRSAI